MNKVIIIGAGPAGMAAALQLKRYGVDFTLYERKQVGGLLNNANLVENYPGFPGGIKGEKLVELFHQQIRELGVGVIYQEVQLLDFTSGCFRVETRSTTHLAPIVVVASGTKARTPQGIDIPESQKSRVLSEIMTIRHVEGKRIAIVGAGDLAFDYALNLGRQNDVLILNRSQEVSCLALLWERFKRLDRSQYRDQIQVTKIEPGERGELTLQANTQNGRQTIACDYLVFAIGRGPNTDFFSDGLRKMSAGLEQSGALHLIGDVKNGIYRQAAIAVGDGILTAMKIYRTMGERT